MQLVTDNSATDTNVIILETTTICR